MEIGIRADLESKEDFDVNTADFTAAMERLKATKPADRPAGSPPTVAELGRIVDEPAAAAASPPPTTPPNPPPTTQAPPPTPSALEQPIGHVIAAQF